MKTKADFAAASRKGAAARAKARRAFDRFLRDGTPVGPPEYAPGGKAVGASPVDASACTIPAILARLGVAP